MKRLLLGLYTVLAFGLVAGVAQAEEKASKDAPAKSGPKLPENLTWHSNHTPPSIASEKAVQGGTISYYLPSFPLTLRYVGPDSNGAFRAFYDDTRMALLGRHPNTDEVIPGLAREWAFSEDNKTLYARLYPNAKWSDGTPVTADDFAYTLEFMTSEHLIAPWYNEYYGTTFEKVIKYDDHTLAVVLKEPRPELDISANLAPTPKHFFHPLGPDFVTKFNWLVPPTTGPYQISQVNQGRSIVIERVKDWWAKDLAFFKNRFNVDRIVLEVIREMPIAFEHFRRGRLDFFYMVMPDYWHDRTNVREFQQGYIARKWFFTDAPETEMNLEINTSHPILSDLNVRLGIAHGINVERVLEQVLRGDYFRAQGISRGYGAFTNNNIVARPYDLEKANAYFEKAGFTERGPDGIRRKGNTRLTARLTYSYRHAEPRLVVMREELRRAGFDLQLHLVDGSLGFKHMQEKQHEIAYTGWGTLVRPDYWSRFHSENSNKESNNNFSNMDDKEITKAVEAYRNSLSLEDRIKYAHEIQQRVHDSAAIITLFSVPYFRIGYWRYIKFPEPAATKSSGDIELYSWDKGGLFWIDPKKKEEVSQAQRRRRDLGELTIVDETFRAKTPSEAK